MVLAILLNMAAVTGPHVTVLVTTYQAERHLAEQLDSVLVQSRPPDLVVVADDASTDSTEEIVALAARRTDVPIRWTTRASNVGLRANIEAGLVACPRGLVVLADHDDVRATGTLT